LYNYASPPNFSLIFGAFGRHGALLASPDKDFIIGQLFTPTRSHHSRSAGSFAAKAGGFSPSFGV
jgi:hypothetical protein